MRASIDPAWPKLHRREDPEPTNREWIISTVSASHSPFGRGLACRSSVRAGPGCRRSGSGHRRSRRGPPPPAQRLRIDAVLDLKHARGERRLGVAVMHRHRALRDDRAGIHLRHDEMHGRAVLLHAGCERARVGVEALEGRQQRGMDVEQPSVPAATNQGVSSRMKPARQTSSILCACKLVLQRALERLAVLAERPVIDDGGARCRRRARALEPLGVGLVGDDQRDLGRIGLDPSPPRSAPPCWSRGRRSGWRRACEPCVSRR